MHSENLITMKKSLIALAFGTLGLGIAEFVMMGILPDVAKALNISIATAGHLISAYAIGVCVGAPLLIIARKYPLKNILLVLVSMIMLGNIIAASAPNYWILMLGRFISGLPHGAYFGVGSIVAEKLADKGKGSEAVSIMIAGMTVANLFGVPGHFAECSDFLEDDFFIGRRLGSAYPLLYLALGASGRKTTRYRFQGTVPFFEITGSLVNLRSDHAR